MRQNEMSIDIGELEKEKQSLMVVGQQISNRLDQLEKEKANLIREFHRIEGHVSRIDWMLEKVQPDKKVETVDEVIKDLKKTTDPVKKKPGRPKKSKKEE